MAFCALWIIVVAALVPGLQGAGVSTNPTPSHLPTVDPAWAFRPVRRLPLPTSTTLATTRHRRTEINPIDAWVQASLHKAGIEQNPQASPRTLIRRVYFDLLGLPPSSSDVAAFEKDTSPEAWERVIDRLLAMPQYGERWARHWLDVARFAQSNGYERDGEKLYAWRYRDYVVSSFNTDKPYDQFVREQIAGDEWVSAGRSQPGDSKPMTVQERDAIIGTGFLRLGVSDDEPDDKLQAEFDELDDMTSSTGAAFLGLTLGCARCHDHKFDPIAQSDYYSLVAFFRSLRTSGRANPSLESSTYAPLALPSQIATWKKDHATELRSLNEAASKAVGDAKKSIEAKITRLKESKASFEWALAGCEREDAIPVVQTLVRGNPRTPGTETPPGFLKAITPAAPHIQPIAGDAPSSGRRRSLAQWITQSDNPLTSRVLVNRVWHHHFGHGIVKTTTDFGRAGSPPTHPELLDWLASEFVREGWSIKKLHRWILTSDTWKQSSDSGPHNAKARTMDPSNDLLWRQNLRRLDAEALRDTILSISGSLNLTAGGRGYFPKLSGEILAGGSRPGTDWEVSSVEEQSRRSLYAYIRRTSMPPMMEAFDYNNATSTLGERTTTTVAPQALMLLNDAFLHDQSAVWATRLLQDAGKQSPTTKPRPVSVSDSVLQRAWEQATARTPRPAELKALREFVKRERQRIAGSPELLHFRPDVPDTISIPYFNMLPAEQFFVGPPPREGWSYFKGRWTREYEGNKNMDEGGEPFALWEGREASVFEWSGEWILNPATESVSLLFGMRTNTTAPFPAATGMELIIRARTGNCELRRLESTGIVSVARSPLSEIGTERLPMRVEVSSSRVRAWIAAFPRPVIDVSTSSLPQLSGQFGVKVWGAGAGLDHARVRVQGHDWPWSHSPTPDDVNRYALESACLLLLNLNEVCYVD